MRDAHAIRRLAFVFAGILAAQLILYGASFAGTKILLPLDILAMPGTYIQLKVGESVVQPHNEFLGDPVFEDEPGRLFRNAEFRAGRLPLWNPYQYTGVPSMSVFSPFAVLGALVRSPRVLPWIALTAALVSGFGVCAFARRVLEVGVWPATIAAWSYPVTGFFVLWQGYSLVYPVVWLPWLLLAVNSVVRGQGRWALAGMAVVTALVLVSGHLDIAGQVLLVSGLFGAWDFFFTFRRRCYYKVAIRKVAALVAGWMLGLMLASPELLPALEYAKTGSRVSNRSAGHEERPPVGLAALPQLVLPHFYGTSEKDSFPMLPAKEANLLESPAAGFAGLLASLAIAPLAFASRRHRSVSIFLAAIGFLGLAWSLNVPGVVGILRLPGLNLMSHNRFVFATSFAILALAAIGLEVVSRGTIPWRRWCYIPIVILVGLAAWCIFRAFSLPQPIAVTIPQAISQGHSVGWIEDAEGIRRVQRWFVQMYLSGAICCIAALIFWTWIGLKRTFPRWVMPLLGAALVSELLFFGYGRAAQCDPRLYYPPVPALDRIARSPPGRVLGYGCLPANLLQTKGLFDVRGYDGVDPARLVDLLEIAAAPDTIRLDYAAVQSFTPRVLMMAFPDSVRLPPVLDLLGVRYLVYASSPAPGSPLSLRSTEYFTLVNPAVLTRVFVPLTVEVESDYQTRLTKLASAAFDPREIAYVEEPVDLPTLAKGEAKILREDSQRITIRANMQTPGLIVLADLWNKGWHAQVNGKSVPILHVDHAVRGVVAPAGESTIIFRYAPTSLKLGLAAASFALVILLAQIVFQKLSIKTD